MVASYDFADCKNKVRGNPAFITTVIVPEWKSSDTGTKPGGHWAQSNSVATHPGADRGKVKYELKYVINGAYYDKMTADNFFEEVEFGGDYQYKESTWH